MTVPIIDRQGVHAARSAWARGLCVAGIGSIVLAATWGLLSACRAEGDSSTTRLESASAAPSDESPKKGAKPILVREGSQIEDQRGWFHQGDRWSFVPLNGRERFTVLENLNLERIISLMAERPDIPLWRVSGSVTEFRGANYLLVEHAEMTGSPAPQPPPAALP